MVKIFKDSDGNGGVVYAMNGMIEWSDLAQDELTHRIKSTNLQNIYNYKTSDENFKKNITKLKDKFYGTTNIDILKAPKNTHIFTERLQELLTEFDKKIEGINITELNQKKTLQFNDKEIGMFSFDLASIGLLPVFEYYSPYLKTTVNPMDVKSRLNEIGDREFYHVALPYVAEHKVIVEGPKYFSPILEVYIDINELEKMFDDNGDIYYVYPRKEAIPEHIVIQRPVLMDNGMPKYTSTWKKSFIYLEKNPYQLPQIDIIVDNSFVWDKEAYNEIIYNALAPMAVIKALNDLNVKNRIFYIDYLKSLDAYSKKKKPTTNDLIYRAVTIVKLKDVNDAIDYNTLSIVTSDSVFLRAKNSTNKIAAYNLLNIGDHLTGGLGYPQNNVAENVKVFNQTITEAKDFGESDPKYYIGSNESNKIVFPNCITMEQAKAAYENAINKIKTLLAK